MVQGEKKSRAPRKKKEIVGSPVPDTDICVTSTADVLPDDVFSGADLPGASHAGTIEISLSTTESDTD